MSYQNSDKYVFSNTAFELVAFTSPLFNPQEQFKDICKNPKSSCVFTCEYGINKDDMLVINELSVECDDHVSSLKEINSCTPKSDLLDSEYVYENLNYEIPYTGEVLFGSGSYNKCIELDGVATKYSWLYKNLYAYSFKNGKLVNINDLSYYAELFRLKHRFSKKAQALALQNKRNDNSDVFYDNLWWTKYLPTHFEAVCLKLLNKCRCCFLKILRVIKIKKH